tara:strand:+ start:2792 stop:4789 length:1998 start_codon:yes stop_codon:yes gene_type:complete
MRRKLTKIKALASGETVLPITKSREKCDLFDLMNSSPSPFHKNAIKQGYDLALISSDKILAVGMTQIGKQTMMLNQSLKQYQLMVEAVRLNRMPQSFFFNFDYACASSRNLVEKKKEDRAKFWEGHTFQTVVPYVEIIGHNDDLVKAVNNPKDKVVEVRYYKGDKCVPTRVSLDWIKNQIDSHGAFANVQLDEIHQYKTLGGALHTFLREYVGVRLTEDNRENCKVICVTATPFDTMAFMREMNIPAEVFRPKWLYPPESYYGWENFEQDDLFDDFDYYAKKAKDKYENNPEEKNRYLNYAVLWWIKDHYEHFMYSRAKDSIVVRHPYTGRKSKHKQEHLVGLINEFINSKKNLGDCKVLFADAKKENEMSREIFESRVGIKKAGFFDLESRGLDDVISGDRAEEKAIFLLVDLYGVGVSVKTETIYGWCEPDKGSTDATYVQRCGRPCGSDKAANHTRICASKRRLLDDLGAAYEEYSKNEQDLNILAVKSSGTHKVTKRANPVYEHKIVDSVKPIYKAKGSSHQEFNPLKLSTRGANKSPSFQEAVRTGEVKSPTALIIEAIQAIEKGGFTLGNVCYPNEYGGETNCGYEGRNVYGTLIDAPCIYATDEEKEFLKPYIGKILISYYGERNVYVGQDPTVLNQARSKRKSNMMSDYQGQLKSVG